MSGDVPTSYVPLVPYPTDGKPDALKDNINLNEYYQVSNGCLSSAISPSFVSIPFPTAISSLLKERQNHKSR